jgi:Outer membrane protein beta-barrel family
MYKLFFTLSIYFISTFCANAQKTIVVKGSVKTEDGKALSKAFVSLYIVGEKDTLKTLTADNGMYTFKGVSPQKVMITISHVGFKKLVDTYDFTGASGEMVNNDVLMTVGDNMLETVTVEASKIYIKEDTVSYRIDSTMFRKNDNVEEVLKKLPGVEVDKDGKVTAQGKEVTKVKVNGKEFFGGDVKTATRQINADMVDKIQIVDDYGDQAAFTGVKDGDPTKTMNIQLKKDKNKGVFGSTTLGAGTDKRYLASLNLNLFDNARQISITSNLNNTNASPFDFSRIPGSIMRSFGGMGGGVPGFAGFGNNDGINQTKTAGINYRDEWSPKVSVNGSYSFSTRATFVDNDLYRQSPSTKADSSIFTKQISLNNSVTDNHRFSFNLEYKIDSFNYIKFNPSITFRKLNEDYISTADIFNNKAETLSKLNNSSLNTSNTPNFSGSLLYNHRFQKKGRTLSMNLSGGKSTTTGDDNLDNDQDIYLANAYLTTRNVTQNTLQDNSNYNYGVSVSFNEQLTKRRGFEINYAYNKRFIENDRETFDILGSTRTLSPFQTNIYNNTYITNRIGANYRITQKKYNYSVGLAVQPATIESNTFTGSKLKYKQSIVNYFPVMRIAYNFSKSKSLNINYNGNTNQPTFQQSQPTPDFSNLQNITIGNPDLRPEFSNTFSLRYNNFDFISGNVFFGNLSATFIKDKIVNDVTRVGNFGGQEIRYLNENGYYNINAFYTISKPIKNRKYVFNYGGVINYNNNISYLNSVKNTGKNWVVSQRFSMDYKLKNWFETSGGANFSMNSSNNSLTQSVNNNIRSWTLTHSVRMFFKHDFNVNYDVEKVLNTGYTDNVVANPFIVNATIEKQFLKSKNASIKLQGFDLLNQNINVSRNVDANSAAISDSRTNRIQRYFMMSLVYRFNKFKGAASGGPGFQGPPGGGGGMRMMGGPGF